MNENEEKSFLVLEWQENCKNMKYGGFTLLKFKTHELHWKSEGETFNQCLAWVFKFTERFSVGYHV